MFRVAGYHAEIGGKLSPISAASRGLFVVAKNLWLVMHYDGIMPLNIGTFPRQENGETFFDGIIPTVKLDTIRQLYMEGNTAVHKFFSENCSWISEVKEFDVCDSSGTVHVNIFTKFASNGGDAESVKEEFTEVFECLQACSNCLLSNNAKHCEYPSLKEVCTRCKTGWTWKPIHVSVHIAYTCHQTRPHHSAKPTLS